MTTREEIEAAVERFEGSGGFACSFIEECEDDLFILAQAYIADRQQRERDQQPPTREMFERLGAKKWGEYARISYVYWWNTSPFPVLAAEGIVTVELDTIAKLRAACLLLGIETEGIL